MNTKNNAHKSYYFFYFLTLWFAIICCCFFFAHSDLWHQIHFINYGIRSSGCRITNYENYAMIQKPILFSYSFRLLWVSVVVIVVIEALLWTRSQNPFWPETGLQAFRQLKALTWTRLGIAAGHEIAVWHAVTHSTQLATHTSLLWQVFPTLCLPLAGVVPRL